MSQLIAQSLVAVPQYRFRPIYRLCKTDEYSSVFAFRRSVRGRIFVLHYQPIVQDQATTPTEDSVVNVGARLGLVVAKKFAKSAVLRNLIKRLVRNEFRHVRETLPAYHLIMRLNAPARDLVRRAMRDEIAYLFKRLPR